LTIDERLICASPELSAIDVELGKAVTSAGVPAREQRQWVSERNRDCGLSRDTDPRTLDRSDATDCLYRAYEDRLAAVRAMPVKAGANAPKRFPHLPHLTEDHAPTLCRALEAAEQEAFRTASPTVSAIDRPWPGVAVTWVISPDIVSDLDISDLDLAKPVDLDGDGKSEVLVLTGRAFGSRGDTFTLVRFASEADFKAFEARADKSGPGTGESILVTSSGRDHPFPWDWHFPAILAVNGQYYLLEEGAAWEDAAEATLYRLKAVGKPEPICSVQRRPGAMADWQSRAGMTELFSRLDAMAGGAADCGTLNAAGRLAHDAWRIRTRALLRPWATSDQPYNDRKTVDGWLASWATEGLRNWNLYGEFEAAEVHAVRSLASWYGDEFGLADAEGEARRVIELVIRGNFTFPAREAARPSPLAAALLKGAPVADVAPLLIGADLGQPKREDEVGSDAPLALAVLHPHLVRALLDAGAPANSSNAFGKTPLMYAAQFDSAEAVRMLLAAGAEVNARTRQAFGCALYVATGDRTPLHYAAENAALEVIRLLVEAGADIAARVTNGNRKPGEPGETPIDYLARNTRLSDADRQQAMRLLGAVP
jgi:uncharacterized protein